MQSSPWWTPPASVPAGQFTLTFAGEASFTKAIVLLFSNPVNVASATAIRVATAQGQPVNGHWVASANNPRMLVFDTGPGHYTVTVPTAVKNTHGATLDSTHSGPVVVH